VIRRGRPAFAPKSEGESAAAEETAESGGAAPDAGAEPSDSSGDNAADVEFAENVTDATDATDEKPAGNAASDNPGGSADGPDLLRALADGRVYSAADAKRLGLIDEIGFLQDAAETMIKEEFKVSDEDVEIVRYRKPESVLSILGVKADPTPAQKAASVIQALSTPTLYYMVPGTFPSLD
ncbi:MAG: S49 family peptidase, partial [Thermoguttaceae bacterium]|nr:S49 family peptidase [Thermoguttaceae bacterium]